MAGLGALASGAAWGQQNNPVQNLRAMVSADGTQIELHWDPPADAGSVNEYRIERFAGGTSQEVFFSRPGTPCCGLQGWDDAVSLVAKTTYTYEVRPRDRDGASVGDDASVTVRFARPPGTPVVSNQEATVDSPFSYQFDAVTDPDGDAVTYAAIQSDGSSLPSWLSFDGASRTFSGTPVASDVGAVEIRVTATDDDTPPLSSMHDFTITVAADPVIVASGTYTVPEDADPGTNVGAPLIARGFPPGTGTWMIPAGNAAGAFSITTTGQLQVSGSLDHEATPSYTLTVMLTQGSGTATTTVTVTVTNVNEPPAASGADIAPVSVPEDGDPASRDVAGNFSDPDAGDSLSFAASSSDNNVATVSVSGSTVTVSPVDVGTAMITVTARDGGDLTATRTFAVTVTEGTDNPSRPPAPSLQNQTVTRGETFTYTFPEVVDLDGDTVTYAAMRTGSSDSSLPGWISFDPATRTFSGTGDTVAAISLYTIRVTVTDSGTPPRSNSADFRIRLIHPPLGPTYAVRGLNAVVNPEGTGILVTWDPPSAGSTNAYIIERQVGDGAFAPLHEIRDGVLSVGQAYTDTDMLVPKTTYTYRVTPRHRDEQGAAPPSTASVRFARPPGTPAVSNQEATVGVPFSYQFAAVTDPDGDMVSYQAFRSGETTLGWLSFDADTRTLSGTPTVASTISIRIVATDDDTPPLSSSADFDIVTRPAPTIRAPGTYSVHEDAGVGESVGQTLQASDFSAAGQPTWSITAGNDDGAFSITNGGQIQVAAALDHETRARHTLTVQLEQGGETATTTVSIEIVDVNEAPVAVRTIDPVNATEGDPAETRDVADSFSDPDDGDTLTYEAQSDDTAVATVTVSGSVVSVTPVAMGSATITVTASDLAGLEGTQTIGVTVAERVPSADATLSALSTAPGGAVSGFAPATLSYTVQVGNETGSITVTPTAGDSGATITVNGTSVASGAASGAITLTAGMAATVTIVVTAESGAMQTYTLTVNRAGTPTITGDTFGMVTEDDPAQNVATGRLILNNPGGDTRFNPRTSTSGGRGRFELSADGTWSYTLDNTAAAVQRMRAGQSITVPFAAHSNAFRTTVFTSVGIRITGANDAPTAQGAVDAQTLVAGGAVATVDVSGNFDDVDMGDTLTYSIGAGHDTAVATATVSPAGVVTITSVGIGPTTVTVVATDVPGATAEQDIDVTVMPVPSIAGSGTYSVPESAAPGANVGAALTATGFPAGAPSWSISGGNAGGAFSITNAGQIQVASALDHETTESYTLTVQLSQGGQTATTTVAVSVADVNEAPAATGTIPAITASAGGPAVERDVADRFSDPDDGDTLTYAAATSASGIATATVSGSVVSVTPVAEGSATITVTARDPDGLAATGTIAVTVDAEPGIAATGTYSVPESAAPGANVGAALTAANFPAGAPSWSITGGNAGGAFSVTNAGQIQVASALDHEAVESYTLTVQLSQGGRTATTTVAVSVADVNEAPAATGTIPAIDASAGGPAVERDVADRFSDPDDGDTLTYAAATSASGVATATVSGSVVSVTPVAEGSATITVTARDPDGLAATGTIAVTVGPAPSIAGSGTYSVPESAAPGANVGAALTAANFPAGAPSWSITGGNAGGAFSITNAGQIQVASALDHEAAESYTLTVRLAQGGRAATTTVAVAVADVNEAPAATGTILAIDASAGGPAVERDVADRFSDPDDGDTLTYAAATSASGVATATVSGSVVSVTPVGEGVATITVTARDPDGLAATQAIDVTVGPAPGADATLSALSTAPGGAVSGFDPANFSYVVQVGRDVASITVTPTASDAAATITVNGTPVASGAASGAISLTAGATATVTIVVTAESGAAQTYTLAVSRAANVAPPAPMVTDQEVTVGGALSYQFAAVADPEGDTVAYAAARTDGGALPAWLGFEASTRTFSGTPGAADAGSLAVRVTATDDGAPPRSSSADFTITVSTVTVSIAGGSAAEGEGIAFTVSLSRSPAAPVTVNWATSDGTAMAGADYTAVADGTHTFPANASGAGLTHSFTVSTLVDELDEVAETFAVTLSAGGGGFPDGVMLGTATATGRILGDLAPPPERARRTSERTLPHLAEAMVSGTVAEISGRIDAAASSALPGESANLAGSTNLPQALRANGRALEEGAVGIERLLGDSSFVLPLDATGDGADAGAVVWGSGDWRRMSGPDGSDISWDGDMFGFHLGADVRVRPGLLAGLSVSWHSGSFDYTDATDSLTVEGRYESTMTGVHPYLSWSPSAGAHLWATVGYGQGEIEVAETGEAARSSDTEMASAGVGASYDLLSDGGLIPGGTAKLQLKGDGLLGRIEAEGGEQVLPAEYDVRRLRVLLKGSYECPPGDAGGCLTPSVEAGLRHDGGDARSETGLELGGALRYADPAIRLTVELRGRALATAGDGYEDWGFGGLVRIDPGPDGLGLSLRLAPGYGDVSSRVDRMHDRDSASLADGAGAPAGRLETELGYGFAHPAGVLTPHAGGSLGDGERAYWLGVRLEAEPSFRLGLEGGRRETGILDPDHEIMARGQLRW